MEHLFSVDAALAMEVQITREIFDSFFAKARRNQVRALYAFHAHERATKIWNDYVGAVAHIAG